MRRWILLLLCVVMTVAQARSRPDWSKTALRDLTAIHQILSRDTVAAIDPADPTFRLWLNIGFQKAKRMALHVHNIAGFAAVDQFYVNGFHDYHVAIVSRPWPPNMEYPGFLIQRIGSYYRVAHAGHTITDLPVGAVLISCQQASPKQLMQKLVLPYFGNPKLQSTWIYNTPRLLTDWDNPFARPPSHCVFRVKDAVKRVSLSWQKSSQRQLNRWLIMAAYPYQPKFEVKTLPGHVVWVNFPAFKVRNPASDDLAQMKRLSEMFGHFQNKKAVVVDVRGNHGGNSYWADQMLSRLYGKAYFRWAFQNDPPFNTQFRLSKLTIDTFEKHLKDYRHQFGLDNKKTYYLEKFVTKMKKAYAAGQTLFPQHFSKWKKVTGKKPEPLYHGRFVIVMDGRCNSACLTFIYEAKRFPNVLLVGKTSGADTFYTESTTVKLPSNLKMSLSISKSVGRGRGSNQPYYPDKVYPGNINDTAALQAWVLKDVLLNSAP